MLLSSLLFGLSAFATDITFTGAAANWATHDGVTFYVSGSNNSSKKITCLDVNKVNYLKANSTDYFQFTLDDATQTITGLNIIWMSANDGQVVPLFYGESATVDASSYLTTVTNGGYTTTTAVAKDATNCDGGTEITFPATAKVKTIIFPRSLYTLSGATANGVEGTFKAALKSTTIDGAKYANQIGVSSSYIVGQIILHIGNVPAAITKFTLDGTYEGAIDQTAKTITLTLPYDYYNAHVTSMTPVFTNTGTFVTANPTNPTDFTSPVTYTVKNDAGDETSYVVTVNREAASSVCKLSTFSVEINGEVRQGTIDETKKTIVLKLPYSYKTDATKKSAIKTNFTFEDDKATASLKSGDNQNYSSSNSIPDFITITAQDGTTKSAYSLSLDYEVAETGKSILSFDLAGGQTVISEADKTIKVTVSGSTNIKNIAPTITVSSMATVSPASGVAQDFTNPVTYTVTAEDGMSQSYTVTVVQDASLPKITKITPADNATGVSLGGTVTIEFDKNVILGSGGVTIAETATPSKSFSLTPNVIPTEGTTTVTLPFSGLSGLTKYTLSVPTGSFVDLYGNQVDLKSITFTTADGTLHTADLPYASKMNGSDFAQPAFIIGGTYDATADTKAATTTQYGAYKLAAGENMTLTAGSAGTVDVVFYSRSTGSYSISSLATTNVTTGTINHYTNKGVENSLTIDSSNTSTVTITNTGTTDLYVAYISVSKVGEAAITEQAANCK